MSNTTQGVDARAYLRGWTGMLADMTAKDIRAIPDDKWLATHGGCSKSAAASVADAIGILDWTAEALRGNAVLTNEPTLEEQLKNECSTKAGAIAKLQSAAAAFGAALSDASDEALNSIVTPPWRVDAPLFAICQVAASHLWYHDGQLNYIQTLLGDDQIHWMDA